MRWYFRDISEDPSEKELTQQDQFNNDEVALAEAIVRETVQNSTDAQAKANVPVRVRFAITEIEASNGRAFFEEIIAGLSPHLRACGMPIPTSSEPLKALVVEDFGTTGLTVSAIPKAEKLTAGPIFASVSEVSIETVPSRPLRHGAIMDGRADEKT